MIMMMTVLAPTLCLGLPGMFHFRSARHQGFYRDFCMVNELHGMAVHSLSALSFRCGAGCIHVPWPFI